jgi:hypothetical protein
MHQKISGSRLKRFIERDGEIALMFTIPATGEQLHLRYHDSQDPEYVKRHAQNLQDPVHVNLITLLIDRFCPRWRTEPYYWSVHLHEDKCMFCVRGPNRMDIFFLNQEEARIMIPHSRNISRLIDRRVGELWNLGDPDITAKFKEALSNDVNAINGFGIDQHLFARSSLLNELRKVVSATPQKTTKPATVHNLKNNNSTKG